MTTRHHTDRHHEAFDEFESRCREQGYKLTHQRREIFAIIADGENHPSAEEIYEKVHASIPSISLDTVYRTVGTLEQLGIVHRFQAPDGRFRYDTNLDRHQHLICSSCGKIQDISWTEFEQLKTPRTPGWQGVRVEHVDLRGLCPDCRK